MNTALRILKALQERNKTLSELSREVGVTKPTLLYHLSKLSERGLVKKVQNGNKFVYYSLTVKGRKYVRMIVSFASSAIIAYALTRIVSSEHFEELKANMPTSYVGYVDATVKTNCYVAFVLAFIYIFIIIYVSMELAQER